MKKINILVAILVLIFAENGLKAQTYPVPKFSFHVQGGYTLPLPDLKGSFPNDVTKNPTPYFMKSGYNVGADGKYFVDKKSTFGVMLSANYTSLSSGSIGVSDPTWGTGTLKTTMTIFTIGVGAEYDFAPKRPANPFVNAQFTTNFIGGSRESDLSGGSDTTGAYSGNVDMKGTVRLGAQFAAGVDVKLSKKIGIIIGGRYAFLNLFGKGSYTANTTTNTYLNDVETTTMKAKKIDYLQFFAGISFYFGQKKAPVIKK